MTNNNLARITVLIFILIVLITGNAGASLMQKEQLTGDQAIIVSKFTNCIVIKNHTMKLPSDYIMVTPTSRLYDTNNNSISLEDLKLPCAVSIRYHLKSKSHDAELINLKVLEYAEKTSSRFNPKKPFTRDE